MQEILTSQYRLQEHIEKNNYHGYDPYDALKSPIFNFRLIKNSKKIRFYTQQFIKRFPLNLRHILLIPKGLNPVTLGLSIQAYSYQMKFRKDETSNIQQKINLLIDDLIKLIPEGFSGACWGYDFDWESRYAKIDGYQPTVVATSIIVNALYEYYKISHSQKVKELILSASKFVINDLNRTNINDTICFSYSPFDKQQVFNASIKGVRILSQAYSINPTNNLLKELAQKGAKYVCENQNSDGSWYYSQAKTGKWIDNYHTGYILDSLADYINYCDDQTYSESLNKGVKYYVENFFDEVGFPKFYNDKKFPLDCTSASQSILTLVKFDKIELSTKVAKFAISKMQNEKGYFYFRKFKYYSINTPFMRWSQAWMFAAINFLLSKIIHEDIT